MKTVILCGGKGTRIRAVNNELPKPMLPIGNYPILWHIMNSYAYYGYRDFILCLGYLGWQIKNYFLNFKTLVSDFSISLKNPRNITFHDHQNLECDWNITFVETGENAETGARIRKIIKYVKNDDFFMLTYGDGLSDVDIRKLVAFHKSHNKIATVTGVRPSGRFGEIEVSPTNEVTRFHEKPQTTEGRINGGFLVIDSKRIVNYLPERDDLNFEQECLRELAKDGELMMFPHDGFWQPMDTFREYSLLNNIWLNSIEEKKIPWPGEKLR